MKNKRVGKKRLSAFLLLLLVLSGGIAASPLSGDTIPSDSDESYANLKQIQDSPMQLLDMTDVALPEDFDYIKELNKEFVKDEYYIDSKENKLKNAIREGNYEAWKKAFIELGGIVGKTGIISKEEFEILRAIKKSEN